MIARMVLAAALMVLPTHTPSPSADVSGLFWVVEVSKTDLTLAESEPTWHYAVRIPAGGDLTLEQIFADALAQSKRYKE